MVPKVNTSMEDLAEFEPLWSTEVARYRIKVSSGEDPVTSGIIQKLSFPPSQRTIAYVIIEDENIAIEVRRRMIEAGVTVYRV